MATDGRYRSPQALRAKIETTLRKRAAQIDRPFLSLRREYLYQRFLARVFYLDSPWVLKGGISLLTRMPDARHSKDIDLMHEVFDPAAAVRELREAGRHDLGDHLRYEVVRESEASVEQGWQLTLDVYIGQQKWESFHVDISCERHFVGTIEPYHPAPVAELPELSPLPPFRLYPLEDQVADKVSAMYETHGDGGEPSNRYRDLVDLALLVRSQELDAATLQKALRSRAANARNSLTLPPAMRSPGVGWADGYPAVAKKSPLPPQLHELDAALAQVSSCLNSALDGRVTSGTWKPTDQSWV